MGELVLAEKVRGACVAEPAVMLTTGDSLAVHSCQCVRSLFSAAYQCLCFLQQSHRTVLGRQ